MSSHRKPTRGRTVVRPLGSAAPYRRRGSEAHGAPLERDHAVISRDRHRELRDGLVEPNLEYLDGPGNGVTGTNRRLEAQIQLKKHRPRPRQAMSHDRVEDRAGHAPLDDDLTERRRPGDGLVVVDRVVIATDLREQLDVLRLHEPRELGSLTDLRRTTGPRIGPLAVRGWSHEISSLVLRSPKPGG